MKRRLVSRTALLLVVTASIFRVYVASHLPLTEDESYYWAWSRHLAYGYTDHPPMVAWLIAAFSPLGASPLAVRLPFILCEAVAALAVGATAAKLGGSLAAGTAAIAILAFLPQMRFAIGEALPDGPYMMFWALAIWLAARVAHRSTLTEMALLGVALGGALLSRFFGWALVAGVSVYASLPAQRSMWRRGFWISLAVALLAYAPFLEWNAAHGWANFAFTVAERQSMQAFSLLHLSVISTARFLFYAALFWAVALVAILRPRYALLAWTALPFPTFLAALSFFEVVDSYWLLGPFVSLAAGIGIAYERQTLLRRRALLVLGALPAAFTLLSVLVTALPEGAQASVLRATHGGSKGPFYSSVYAYAPLSADLRTLAARNRATLLTDRFEIASELNYHGLRALIVGSAPQVAQWTRWNNPKSAAPDRALIVTFAPPARNSSLERQVRNTYARLGTGPTLRYGFAGTTAAAFYTQWASGVRKHAETLFTR